MSKRRWFQFHLSTAVVLMFVAGGLVWANLHSDRDILSQYHYGWPFEVHFEYEWQPVPGSNGNKVMAGHLTYRDLNLWLDFGSWLLAIAGTAYFLEWRIRRKAAKP